MGLILTLSEVVFPGFGSFGAHRRSRGQNVLCGMCAGRNWGSAVELTVAGAVAVRTRATRAAGLLRLARCLQLARVDDQAVSGGAGWACIVHLVLHAWACSCEKPCPGRLLPYTLLDEDGQGKASAYSVPRRLPDLARGGAPGGAGAPWAGVKVA